MTRGYNYEENFNSPFFEENWQPITNKPKIVKIPAESFFSNKDITSPANYVYDPHINAVPHYSGYNKEDTEAARNNLLKALAEFSICEHEKVCELEDRVNKLEHLMELILDDD
jgi:hypothetical protein